jgi:hypothetical protein|tara:strand:- start:664 stop:894 length:231 start_codon:yes stop_codon:yes gene_type:complete
MHPLLQELLTNAENKTHIIEFVIDQYQSTGLKLVAPFDLQIVGDKGRAIVIADTRTKAVNMVRNSGLPIKRFIELH